jgi:hypothetical protein
MNKVQISNIETPFTQNKGEALISFLGRVLFAAFQASHKDLAEPLKATLNGSHVYNFKNKVVSVTAESLPKFEKVNFAESGEILKPNFTGFIFNTLFSKTSNFADIEIHKNKAIQSATKKAKNLQQVVSILLAEYSERKLKVRNDLLNGQKLALSYGIGLQVESLKKDNIKLLAEIREFKTAPKVSEATKRNNNTRAKKLQAPTIETVTP